ncbi:hypothetical protein [uncultured Limosilactobacillus sp.]|uniref:hypothetical protein n=1 Tax=uncultured Limosilactobacillus sp. TaxID=2837629 RepID=UPI0025F37F6A|nr:hypothetical protein [uncultured Limosilactobacillus sp.]
MQVSDFLLLIAVVLIWMVLSLFSPFWAAWATFPVMVTISWLVVKTLEGNE